MGKIKGIRLNEKELDWWENPNIDAPEKIREFIRSEIEKQKSGIGEVKENLKYFPPSAIERLDKILSILMDSDDKVDSKNKSVKDKEKLNKVKKLIDAIK